MLLQLPGLAQRWRAGEWGAALFAVLYFLHWQIAIHGQAFASRKCRNDPKPDMTEWLNMLETGIGEGLHRCLLDRLERYQFHGVISNVPVALVHWLRGDWPLVLREDIPGPTEVLRMQARGCRAVTVLTEYPRLRQPVLNKPDAFAFFLHDLEHAYKYFHSPDLHAGQRAFFSILEQAFDRDVFAPYFDDAEFIARFHYLMSDMNTHPEHSRQYLRAILVEFHLRHERKAPAAPLSPTAERAIEGVMCAVNIHRESVACA